MKALTARQIIRILEANDFQVARQRGSHIIYRHTKTKQIVPVPLHGGNKPGRIVDLLWQTAAITTVTDQTHQLPREKADQ